MHHTQSTARNGERAGYDIQQWLKALPDDDLGFFLDEWANGIDQGRGIATAFWEAKDSLETHVAGKSIPALSDTPVNSAIQVDEQAECKKNLQSYVCSLLPNFPHSSTGKLWVLTPEGHFYYQPFGHGVRNAF